MEYREILKNSTYFIGIQRYVMFGLIGAAGGYYLQQWFFNYFAFRDQIFRHYVATHPEEFPAPGWCYIHCYVARSILYTSRDHQTEIFQLRLNSLNHSHVECIASGRL